jgi:hypothetical protein
LAEIQFGEFLWFGNPLVVTNCRVLSSEFTYQFAFVASLNAAFRAMNSEAEFNRHGNNLPQVRYQFHLCGFQTAPVPESPVAAGLTSAPAPTVLVTSPGILRTEVFRMMPEFNNGLHAVYVALRVNLDTP